MWIIFDLDDTLIDTSGYLTPFRLECALKKMIEAGLSVKNFFLERSYLWSINKKTLSSEETIRAYFSLKNIDKKFLTIALQEIYETPLPESFPLKTLPGAKKVLKSLREHRLFLVTKGLSQIQLRKLEKAGIEPAVFCNIIVSDSKSKKPFYQKILYSEGASPSRVVVVGDRIIQDLLPAKELGLWTIQMKWGRGLCFEGKGDYVDFEVSDLAEIKKIVHHLELLTSEVE